MTPQVIYDPYSPDDIIVDPASVPTDLYQASATDAANTMHALEIEADRLPAPADPVTDPIAAARAAAHAVTDQAASSDDAIAALFRAQREAVQAALGGAVPASPSPAPGATEAAIEAKLKELDAMKTAGALDEQTYKASRQRLIDALLQ